MSLAGPIRTCRIRCEDHDAPAWNKVRSPFKSSNFRLCHTGYVGSIKCWTLLHGGIDLGGSVIGRPAGTGCQYDGQSGRAVPLISALGSSDSSGSSGPMALRALRTARGCTSPSCDRCEPRADGVANLANLAASASPRAPDLPPP